MKARVAAAVTTITSQLQPNQATTWTDRKKSGQEGSVVDWREMNEGRAKTSISCHTANLGALFRKCATPTEPFGGATGTDREGAGPPPQAQALDPSQCEC